MKIKKILLFLIGSMILITGCQKEEPFDNKSEKVVIHEEALETITDTEKTLLNKALENITVPSGYFLVTVTHGTQDAIPVTVYRYTKDGEMNNSGELFSITMGDNNNKLIGFTFMDRTFDMSHGLIEQAKADAIAIDFLNRVEPALVDTSKHLWTAIHDETITVENTEYTITGMKYKCYVPNSQLYFWIVVDHNGQIVTFEQDIAWSNGMAERISEQWLHDWWRTENKNF